MKILVVTGHRITGLNYHRQLVPFEKLGYECEYFDGITDISDEKLKEFGCISFLRTIDTKGKTNEVAARLKKLGLIIHFDIDDYWELPTHHSLYPQYKAEKIATQTVEAILAADFVTTTNEYLSNKIKESIGKKAYVLPNAINPEHQQWDIIDTPSGRMRFGYIAGTHHVRDMELLHPSIKKLNEDRTIIDKWQLCPAGFNLNNSEKGLYMNPYYKYVEQIFTHNYKYVKGDYKAYLKLNTPEKNQEWDESYKRLWGMDTYNYGKLYNLVDVSLVPLVDNEFNRCKSNLKIIEAGFMKKPVIISDVLTYKECNSSNAMVVKQNRNDIDWFVNMRKLINEPNLASDLGEALHDYVKDKYHIDTVNIERKQIFEHHLK